MEVGVGVTTHRVRGCAGTSKVKDRKSLGVPAPYATYTFERSHPAFVSGLDVGKHTHPQVIYQWLCYHSVGIESNSSPSNSHVQR